MNETSNGSRRVFMQGNEAILEGAVAAGARFFAGYPITPSSEIAESAARRLPAVGGVYIQMEDEIASMAAIIGASLAGLRSFTATSGPGFSLMQENLGMAVMVEVPCVIVNIQRSGPSTGLATKPAQADVMQARWGTHGDHSIIALAPSSVQDCFSLTVDAFGLAEEYRSPVIVLADEIIGHMRERALVPEAAVAAARIEPGPGPYQPYGVAEGGRVVPLAKFGGPHVFHVTSSMHGASGLPDNTPANARQVIRRLSDKIEGSADALTRARLYRGTEEIVICGRGDIAAVAPAQAAGPARAVAADVLLISFGASARTCLELALDPPQGLSVHLLELNTVWPFPDRLVRSVAASYPRACVVEMNLGQVIREVCRVLGPDYPLLSCTRSDGSDITPDELAGLLVEVCS